MSKKTKTKIESLETIILKEKNYLNEKKTKINLSQNYEYFLKEIKDFSDEELDYMLESFKTKKIIPVLKVLINGFIDFDLNEEKQEIIIKVISRIINIKYKHEKIVFIMIYKKLSKQFRRHSNIKEIKSIQKFDKLFKVWKILYDIQLVNFENHENLNNKDKAKNKNKIKNIKEEPEHKDISEIEYFGGFESFIPLLKIIKYIIEVLGGLKSKYQSNENESKNNLILVNKYLQISLTWIKDIFNIFLNLIFLSESNYLNFSKIIIPLIGALYEIEYSLPNEFKEKLFNEKIVYALYIIILNNQVPNNVIYMYQQLFNNFNLDIFHSLLESFIINLEEIKIKNGIWYFLMILNFLEFINLIPFEAPKEIPLILIDKLKKIFDFNKKNNKKENINSDALGLFISLLKRDKKEVIEKIKISKDSLKNVLFSKILISLINVYLNVKRFLKIINKEFNEKSYINIIPEILEIHTSKIYQQKDTPEEIKKEIKNTFKIYYNDKDILLKLIPFLIEEKDFITHNEFLMKELIDYQGQYHHLMKELFIFNRLWSNKKLFFNDTLEKRKLPNIKYKNINYYTKNFQRPIIYPILDYKFRYPEFSKYKIQKGFYEDKNEDKDKDNNKDKDEDIEEYNFDLIDHKKLDKKDKLDKFDKLIEEYNEKIFKEIKSEPKINKYKACLVKQNYHIKGNLFIVKTDNQLIIYFYGYPYNFLDKAPDSSTCNKNVSLNKNNKDDICYGSLFKCPEKEKNKKVIIALNNIRLILKRIYYYRKSALEIFTQTKSYYFNFSNDEVLNNIINVLDSRVQKSFLPIKINGNIVGYIKVNLKSINENYKNLEISNFDFLEFISNKTSNGEFCDMCIFDIIILLNLISNRSYLDLYQYPVFPLLNFYDKNGKYIPRDFQEHIGFQSGSDESKKRKKRFEELFKNEMEDKEEEEIEDENEEDALNNQVSFFNTRYSNIVYASNYMIRLFPYTFSCIELQGDGFDNPNRLFFAIENTFYNISAQQSDLRELIPEFFYLPEMFMNINFINFGIKSNGEKVSDVIIPKILDKHKNSYDNINIIEEKNMIEDKNIINEYQIINNDINNEGEKQNAKESGEKNDKIESQNNVINCFIFVDYLKSKLEDLKSESFISWINLIFGDKQRYKNIKKKKGQYFKTESFIDVNKETYEKYSKQDLIMTSIEFGVIPLQSINNKAILENFKKRKSIYDIEGYKNIKKIKIRRNKLNLENSNKSSKKKNKAEKNIILESDYWNKPLIITFETDNFGKLKIFENFYLIKEVVDHTAKIIDTPYNQRLNIFATYSLDGSICVYFLPYKLISVIKHPNRKPFDKVYISANPFPSIITYERDNDLLRSYSISGLLIKEKKITFKNQDGNKYKYYINPLFDIYGGNFQDKLLVYNSKVYIQYSIPFFKEEDNETFDFNDTDKGK